MQQANCSLCDGSYGAVEKNAPWGRALGLGTQGMLF